MAKVIFSYEKFGDDKFVVATGTIISKMTGNPVYVTLQAEVDVVASQVDLLQTLVERSRGGSRSDIIDKNVSRAQVTSKLRTLGNHVTAVAKSESDFNSSGFPFSGPAKPTPPLETPVPPRITPGGDKGQLLVKAKKQKGVRSVVYSITSTPDVAESWQSYGSSLSKHLFTGLVSARKYYIRYTLIGARSQSITTDAVMFVAQ